MKSEPSTMKSTDFWGNFTTGKSESKNSEATIIGQSKAQKCLMPKAGRSLGSEDTVTLELPKIYLEWRTSIKGKYRLPQQRQLPKFGVQSTSNTSETNRRSTRSCCGSRSLRRRPSGRGSWSNGCRSTRRRLSNFSRAKSIPSKSWWTTSTTSRISRSRSKSKSLRKKLKKRSDGA